MSQTNKRSRLLKSADDDEYTGIPSQSEMPAAYHDLDVELDRKAKDLVRYALACEQKKTPIRRDDIRKRILQDHPRHFNTVFGRTQKVLQEMLGMKLIELPLREKPGHRAKTSAEATTSHGTAKTYILCNILAGDFDVCSITHETSDKFTMFGVLYIVLALVLVNEQQLSEGDLIRSLTKVGLTKSLTEDELVDMLNMFVKQGYLIRSKQSEHSDGTAQVQSEYQWGPRAKAELTHKGLVNFITSFYDSGDQEELHSNIMQAAGIQQ